MRKAYKYRIYLTKGQRRILEQQLEECRYVYNQTLAARRDAHEAGAPLGLYDTQAFLPDWKAERPALKLVHSMVLQNVQVRVELAFQAFFRRVKAKDPAVGYPRFKSFGRYDSMTFPQYGNGVRLEGEKLILSKVGAVHVVLHRPIDATPKTVTLTRSRTGNGTLHFRARQPRTCCRRQDRLWAWMLGWLRLLPSQTNKRWVFGNSRGKTNVLIWALRPNAQSTRRPE